MYYWTKAKVQMWLGKIITILDVLSFSLKNIYMYIYIYKALPLSYFIYENKDIKLHSNNVLLLTKCIVVTISYIYLTYQFPYFKQV